MVKNLLKFQKWRTFSEWTPKLADVLLNLLYNSMHLSCENVTLESKKELIAFLKKNEEYSLFLLNNLEAYGPHLSDHIHSGNFKILRTQGKIITAFCLAKNGTLLVQSTKQSAEICKAIITACLDEQMPMRGVIGEWDFASTLWKELKEKKIIVKETLIEKDVLYMLDVEKAPFSQEADVRLLQAQDFDPWVQLRKDYVKEMGFPESSLEDAHAEFQTKVGDKITWGLFLDQKLVAIADLNARFSDVGQLGGVYTMPEYRKKGFSTRLIRQLISDLKTIHHIRKLIIFTGEQNLAARKVYESLGVKPYGHFALLFGTS